MELSKRPKIPCISVLPDYDGKRLFRVTVVRRDAIVKVFDAFKRRDCCNRTSQDIESFQRLDEGRGWKKRWTTRSAPLSRDGRRGANERRRNLHKRAVLEVNDS
jgi:hypothetical protein